MQALLAAITLAIALGVAAAPALAQQAGPGPIYGQQLMTEQERLRFHEQMGNAKTAEERRRIQKEHREFIRQRARERGVEMPRDDDGRGMGMGDRDRERMHRDDMPKTMMPGGKGGGKRN